jgi:glycosyltransferase involved in cell wall biosynthesis
VISLCVDPVFLKMPLRQSEGQGVHNRQPILFTSGHLQSPHIAEPLLQFIDAGFRQLRLVWPDLEFSVIGRDAPREIARKLSSEPGVRFAPWVEDYVQALDTADVAIFLDSAGAGIKTRVIQALAAGKPVVGSPIALEGLAVTHGLNAYICKSSDEATEVVLRLLEDAGLRARVGRAARELICQHYTRETTGRQWEALYRSAIEQARARSQGSRLL